MFITHMFYEDAPLVGPPNSPGNGVVQQRKKHPFAKLHTKTMQKLGGGAV